ncbi:hypothetical protein BS47DRAFT_1358302 [Hydnum rufescens UP504]|uniref:Uncharacterized protein n=1 Tax=Hydnum rufescens UP504 TaxID=1448309 RepID=A0A9P6DY62_9AGAM|nr:hypothetical protein BS47DRAFT_1358302 [Hydnum rufescens UP504]
MDFEYLLHNRFPGAGRMPVASCHQNKFTLYLEFDYPFVLANSTELTPRMRAMGAVVFLYPYVGLQTLPPPLTIRFVHPQPPTMQSHRHNAPKRDGLSSTHKSWNGYMDIRLVVLLSSESESPLANIYGTNCRVGIDWLKTPAVHAPEEPDTPDQFESTKVTNMNPGFPASLPISYVAFEYLKPS